MREFSLRIDSVGYRGNGSGIGHQIVDFERIGGQEDGEQDQGEAVSTELSAGLPATEQPLPVPGSVAGGRWKIEPNIREEL